MKPLTKKQRAIYDFIVGYLKVRGMPPTRQEIADAFKLSSINGVQQHLFLISLKGWISLLPGKAARGIVITKRGKGKGSVWGVWEPIEAQPNTREG